MSTAKQTKLKINDVAKDLGVTGQELADFLKEKLDVTKKPAASLTAEEMNIVLEHFSQNNQVDSFEAYFAMRSLPKTEKKQETEKKSAKKPAAKTEKA
ncbi:MAG: translation initiation factor IF-2 N-terminal domain-containing protein, partial [Oscillospiraceae bacterium]|nr:translation initiation factor IF-2 N-terminal domain-containing protein [Oscillospiraceae bacterium]